MSWYHPQSLLDKIFEGGILLKGISGALEFIGGVLVIFIKPAAIHSFLVFITQKELLEDPRDLLANTILNWSHYFSSGSKVYIIAYLWVHAGIKLIAVIGILRNQLWAYPFSLVMLGIFMVYQVYTMYLKFSFGLLFLTMFDSFILWLIWREYKKVKVIFTKIQDVDI